VDFVVTGRSAASFVLAGAPPDTQRLDRKMTENVSFVNSKKSQLVVQICMAVGYPVALREKKGNVISMG